MSQELSQCISKLQETFTDAVTVADIRADHPELDFISDEDVEGMLRMTKSFRKLKQSENKANESKTLEDKEREESGNPVTLGQAFDSYIKKCQVKNLSEASIKHYRSKIGDFIEFMGPDREAASVDSNLVDDYILHLNNNSSLSGTSVVSHMKCVKGFLNFLIGNGFTKGFKVTMPKTERKEIEPYSKDDILALLEEPPQDAKKKEIIGYTFINFMLGTGVRLGTAINVKVSDINFCTGFIHLDRTKSRKEYSIPLADKLGEILKEYIKKFGLSNDDFIFTNLQGKKASERCYQRIVKSYNEGRGVRCTKCHTFRHTFAKEYILAGGDVFRLQKILGHADIKTTGGYVNMFSQDLKRDFNKFNVLDAII